MAQAKTYGGNGHNVTIADPKNITKNECLELAQCGKDAWNCWRKKFPCNGKINSANFHAQIFSELIKETSHGCDISHLNFSGFDFGDHANFKDCNFQDLILFCGASFGDGADFSGATFKYEAEFKRASFGLRANFRGVHFQDLACFDHATFKSDANFSGDDSASPQTFNKISFNKTRFEGEVSFRDRRFAADTNFSDVHFAKAPSVYGCSFDQNTSFENTHFPKANGDNAAARAYRALKQIFSQQQAVREEQHFFKLEMREEAARETGWRRWLYRTYSVTSDFGFSIGRPLVVIILATILAALIYSFQAGLEFDIKGGHTAALVQFSIASAVPGLEKLAEPAAIHLFGDLFKGVANYNLWVVLTLLAHKAVSLLALFLIGLALRNLFKMK